MDIKFVTAELQQELYETNIMLYVNYTSFKKKKKGDGGKTIPG